jgi:hypothetical protein
MGTVRRDSLSFSSLERMLCGPLVITPMSRTEAASLARGGLDIPHKGVFGHLLGPGRSGGWCPSLWRADASRGSRRAGFFSGVKCQMSKVGKGGG